MKKSITLLVLILCLLLSGCSSARKPLETSYFALDTIITTEIYGENAPFAESVIKERILTLEHRLDTDGLDLSDYDVEQLITKSLSLSEATGGAFDITVGAYVNSWGFHNKSYRVPKAQELESLKDCVGYEKITTENGDYVLPEGMYITFGAIAKGYISDIVYFYLENNSIDSALVSLGGNIILRGDNNGKPWNIGIESPEGDGSTVATLKVEDCFVVTSGDYHRNFTRDGITYHHIIDPATGSPAQSDLRSVTIIGENGTEADAFSTALFVMGSEKAIDFWRNGRYDFDFVLITKSGEMLISSPLEEIIFDVAEGYNLKAVAK